MSSPVWRPPLDQSPVLRRAFTTPTNLSSARIPDNAPSSASDRETLFFHKNAKVVSFSPSPSTPSHKSRSESSGVSGEPVGTLPWASHVERTADTGQLRICRLPTSVVFLLTRQIQHAILAKSQGWCVDGETKFVLPMRENNKYFRIELPNTCSEDKEAANRLKEVLAEVSQFEKTPCPFKRGFFVELPEKQEIIYKPWTPKHQPETPQPRETYHQHELEESTSASEGSVEDDRDGYEEEVNDRNSHETEVSQPEAPPQAITENVVVSPSKVESHVAAFNALGCLQTRHLGTVEEDFSVFDDLETPSQLLISDSANYMALGDLDTPTRPRRLDRGRSVTVPLQLNIQTLDSRDSSPSLAIRIPQREPHRDSRSMSAASSVSSMQSFYSTNSPPNALPPSPSDSYTSLSPHTTSPINYVTDLPPLNLPRVRSYHKRDVSELTITASSFASHDFDLDLSEDTPRWHDHGPTHTPAIDGSEEYAENEPTTPIRPETPALTADDINSPSSPVSSSSSLPDPPDSPTTALRAARRAQHRRRNLSPLPSPTNLYTPGHHFTAAILQKTCAILLKPPLQLVTLMVSIAARISLGVLRSRQNGGDSAISGGNDGDCTARRTRTAIPRTYAREDYEDLDEDDYGIILNGSEEVRRRRRRNVGATMGNDEDRKEVKDRQHGTSWEID